MYTGSIGTIGEPIGITLYKLCRIKFELLDRDMHKYVDGQTHILSANNINSNCSVVYKPLRAPPNFRNVLTQDVHVFI